MTARTNTRWWEGGFALLTASAVGIVSAPGFFWEHAMAPWVGILIAALLIIGLLGTLARSRALRAVGWVGIGCVWVLWLSISFGSDEPRPNTSPFHEILWRLLLFGTNAALLVFCFKAMATPPKHPRRVLSIAACLVAAALAVIAVSAVRDAVLERAKLEIKAGEFDRAVSKLKPLASLGDSTAQSLLGDSYAFGRGVARNDEMAAYWHRRAAGQNAPPQ